MSSPSDDKKKRPHHRILKWSLGALATLVILAALAVGLFRIAANMLPRYHNQIAQEVAAQLGAPVRLGRISLVWHGWGPAIRFDRARVLNAKTGEVVLSAQSLRLDFTLFALLRGSRARPSGIGLDGPRVTLQQTASGGFSVPGLTFSGRSGEGYDAMLGVSIQIEDGRLEVRFADPSRAPWVFPSIDLDVGGGRTHAISLALELPRQLGAGSLHVGGELVTDKPAPSQWKWKGRFSLDKIALAGLNRFLPATWPHPTGRLAFDGEARGVGALPSQASARVVARNLAAGGSHVNRIQTNFTLTTGDGFRVTLTDLLLLAPDYSWKPGKLFFGRDGDGRVQAGIARIDLAPLPRLSGFLPNKLAALGERLHKMRPTGEILDTKFGFMPGRIASLDFSARFKDVGVYAAEGAPGFNHLAGEVTMRHGMGVLALDAPGFTLRMPHVFPHTVPLDRAWGSVGIAITDEAVRVALPRLRLTGPAGLDGTIMAAIDIPHEGPVKLRMAASAAAVSVNSARALYMPTLLMPKPLATWLMHQLHGGRVSGGSMRLTGEARRFPFEHGGGHFAVDFQFRGTTLTPGPDWQPLEDLGGSVRFENAGMHAEVTSGEIAHAHVVKSTAAIANFFAPRLDVKAEIAGALPDFVAFLRASPIGPYAESIFDHFEATGAASTRLTIQLPIMHPARFKLAGKLDLSGADVRYGTMPYTLKQLSGSLSYDGDGPIDGRLKGELLDTPVTLVLSREAVVNAKGGKHVRIALSGRFRLDALSKAAGGGDFARYMSGSLPLRVELAVPLAEKILPLRVTFYSDLDGLAIKLPSPAGKSAADRRPFAARLNIDTDTLNAMVRYADVASACVDIVRGEAQPIVHAAEVMLGGGACTPPASGYLVRGGWSELDVGAWFNEFPPKQRSAKKPSPSPWALQTLDMNVRFGKVNVFGQTLKDQTIRGTLGPAQMELMLAGPELAGRVVIPRKPDNANPILAELTRGRFKLPQPPVSATSSASPASAATGVTASAVAAQTARAAATGAGIPAKAALRHGLSPRDIPPFSLHAEQLELGDAELKDVKIVARRVPNGLLVKPIHIGGGALSLDGLLVWLNPPASHSQGALQFVARIDNLGKLLAGFGFGPVVTGHGALSAGLAWREPPEGGKFVDGLLGKVSTDLRGGSISEVSPGAGRLLSLLNLANIPRYLVFNFHNLFGKGFPYNRIHGNYEIRNGIAKTDGLDIDSSIATIKITGSINFPQQTLDQTAAVEPNYFGSLPVIGALVGGLGVGAAVYLITKIFSSPLAEASRMEYSITGPIGKPVVKKVGAPSPPSSRQPAASPAPATAAASGAG